jgi:molecular chaperone DnaK (HSP70)
MSDNVEEIKNKYEDIIYEQWESNIGWEHFKCSIADMLNELAQHYEQRLAELRNQLKEKCDYDVDAVIEAHRRGLVHPNEIKDIEIGKLKQQLAEIEIQRTLFATMANNQIDHLKKENEELQAKFDEEASVGYFEYKDFKSRIDRAVEYLKQGQSIHAFTILTEGEK